MPSFTLEIEIEAPESVLDLLRDSEALRLHLVRAATGAAAEALTEVADCPVQVHGLFQDPAPIP